MTVTDPRQLTGLVGPGLVAIGATEAMNLNAFATQIAPVVYLNGTMLFIAGLAIFRAQNHWSWHWPVIMTLTGWMAMSGGLWRMAFPGAPQAAENWLSYLLLALFGAIGLFLSFKAFGPGTPYERGPRDV
jgi:hypothetical protein